MSAPRGSSRVKHFDDASASRYELTKPGNCWFISQPKACFVERYLRNEIGIALRNREIWGVGRVTNQDGFIWKVAPFLPRAMNNNSQVRLSNFRHDIDEPFVLSEIVQAQYGEEVRIPSLVRFERFDSGDLGFREPLFIFDSFQVAQKVLPISMNWEVGFSVRYYAISVRERCRDHIKRTSASVDDRANISVDDGIEWNPFSRYKQLIAGIRIRLESERIWAFLLPGAEALLKDWDLGFGPIDGGISV